MANAGVGEFKEGFALAAFSGIDVLVINAGIDFLGAIEEQNEDDYRALLEVNFFGAVALLRLVLPGMRRRKRGSNHQYVVHGRHGQPACERLLLVE